MQILSVYPANFYNRPLAPVSFQGKTSTIPTEVVIDKLEKHIPVRKIAAEFGISLDTFYKLLREREIPYKKQALPKRLENITKEIVEELLNSGMTVPQICKKFKITQSVYYNLVERLGVVHPIKASAARLAAITKEEFLDCLNSGMSVSETCKHLHVSSSGYYQLIHKFEIKTGTMQSIENIESIKKEDIEILINAGKSNPEIAEKLNITLSALNSLIAKFGIVTKHIQTRQNISLITKERLQELVNSGKPVKEICEILRISVRTYSRLVKQFGIATERQRAKEYLSSITRETLQTLVNEGLSVSEICQRLKINRSAFYRLLKQFKINYNYAHHYNEILIPKSVLQDKAQSGETTKEIANSLGISVGTYHIKAKQAEVKTVLRDSIDTIADISFETFQNAINKCKSVKEVCRTLNITEMNYNSLMHKYLVDTPQRCSSSAIANVTAEQIQKMRAAGKSVRDICSELYISQSSYYRILNKGNA